MIVEYLRFTISAMQQDAFIRDYVAAKEPLLRTPGRPLVHILPRKSYPMAPVGSSLASKWVIASMTAWSS